MGLKLYTLLLTVCCVTSLISAGPEPDDLNNFDPNNFYDISETQVSDQVDEEPVSDVDTEPQVLVVEEASDDELLPLQDGKKLICVDTHCGLWPDNLAVVATSEPEQIAEVSSEDVIAAPVEEQSKSPEGSVVEIAAENDAPEGSALELAARDAAEPLVVPDESTTTTPPVDTATVPATTDQPTIPPRLRQGTPLFSKGRVSRPAVSARRKSDWRKYNAEERQKLTRLRQVIRQTVNEMRKLRQAAAQGTKTAGVQVQQLPANFKTAYANYKAKFSGDRAATKSGAKDVQQTEE